MSPGPVGKLGRGRDRSLRSTIEIGGQRVKLRTALYQCQSVAGECIQNGLSEPKGWKQISGEIHRQRESHATWQNESEEHHVGTGERRDDLDKYPGEKDPMTQ